MYVIIRKADQAFLHHSMHKYTKCLKEAHHFDTLEEAARETTSFSKEEVVHIEVVSERARLIRASLDAVNGVE